MTVLHRASDAAESALHENKIASKIQEAVLPGEVDIEGLEISAGMIPTEAVGGDYYDIIPVANGCYIGIGDVAGHGLAAGLIMLMIQSTLQGLVTLSPEARPIDLLTALNRMLYENIRKRMKRDEHVTFCLVRYSADGGLVFAGAHESMLICRKEGNVEVVPSRGSWLGAVKDIRSRTHESTLQLGPGDLMLLFTDGVIEARNERGQEFGQERLAALLQERRDQTPYLIRRSIIEELTQWAPHLDDDVTLVLARCQGVYWGS